jgi:hypothetical protein
MRAVINNMNFEEGVCGITLILKQIWYNQCSTKRIVAYEARHHDMPVTSELERLREEDLKF